MEYSNVLNESKNFRRYKQQFVNNYGKTIKDYANYVNRKGFDPNHPIKSTLKIGFLPGAQHYEKKLGKAGKDYIKKVGLIGTFSPDQFKAGADLVQDKKEDTDTIGYSAGAKHYKRYIANQVAKADKAHRGQVVGGYKLESAMILCEAINSIIYSDNDIDTINEAVSIAIDSINTLFNE